MSKYDDAIELLRNYARNAARVAEESRILLELLDILRRTPSKPVKDLVLPIIKDRVSNLEWSADQDLDVGRNSTEGLEQLEEALHGAIKSATGRGIKWHARWIE